MYIDANTIIQAGEMVGAIALLGGGILTAYRWYLKQNKQDEEIEKMKNDGVRVVVIAEKIGVHRATIYNELKRGGTPYRAEVAQKTI